MNIVRLNTAHQTPEDTLKIVNNVRKISDDISLLVDTKGPEVRTKDLENKIMVSEGDIIYIGDHQDKECTFQVNYDNFVKEVPAGSQVLIDDGSVIMTVKEKNNSYLTCEILNKGEIANKKSVNVPGVHLNVPSLSDKDKEYIQFAIENDLDFIAHSFVRNKEDVAEIQSLLDKANSRVKIIAKIENKEGVDNIEEILENVYGVMIARGDLGVEMPGEVVPVIQKKIINICMRMAKPVITATQMLHSMIENPAPTRAEISDVANAIYDGTDAIMLSGETAYGKYPVESVKTMTKIALTVEEEKAEMKDLPVFQTKNIVRNYLAKCTVSAAKELPVKAIIIDTLTGFSARTVSAYRGKVPIYAKCHDKRIVRELMLNYGIYPSFMEMPKSTDQLVVNGLKALLEDNKVEMKDLVAILAGVPDSENDSDFLEINTVENCLVGKNR